MSDLLARLARSITGHWKRSLLIALIAVFGIGFLSGTAGDAPPGADRLLRATRTYLDACLRERGVRSLLLEARAEPVTAAEVRARNAQNSATCEEDFTAMGWAHPYAAAQLWVGMAAEAALLEFDAGKRVKALRAALAFQASLTSTLLLILAAVVTMYIVLGVLYESYIHPVTILSTLPSAGVGALLALLAARLDLGIIAIIGIVLLIGIVKKNAIMMIDFALEAEREQGLAPRDAIYQACLLRFRPILMTTLAALLGALPLMLGTGTGSELRHPLGVTMVGGLIVSQMLTLFTTPVIYLSFAGLARRWREARA